MVRKGFSIPVTEKGKRVFSGWGKLAPSKRTRAIAKRAERKVKDIARAREIKYHNYTNANNMDTSGVIECLTEIPQGDTASTRDGNQVSLRSIRLTAKVQNDGTAGISSTYRIIVFQDKQQVSDTSPAVGDVLLSASPISNYNYPDVTKRFKILYDKLFTIRNDAFYNTSTTSATSLPGARVLRKFLYPTMKNAKYNGTTGTDYQKNMVYILYIADTAEAGNTLDVRCQVSFTDS